MSVRDISLVFCISLKRWETLTKREAYSNINVALIKVNSWSHSVSAAILLVEYTEREARELLTSSRNDNNINFLESKAFQIACSVMLTSGRIKLHVMIIYRHSIA